jgi:hypothetical protein
VSRNQRSINGCNRPKPKDLLMRKPKGARIGTHRSTKILNTQVIRNPLWSRSPSPNLRHLHPFHRRTERASVRHPIPVPQRGADTQCQVAGESKAKVALGSAMEA